MSNGARSEGRDGDSGGAASQGPSVAAGAAVVARLRGRRQEMVARLDELVMAESPSDELAAMARCIDLVAATGEELLGSPVERLEVGGRVHLRWRTDGGADGEAERSGVAVVGHLDTVWPLGTVERWPFTVRDDGTATGPGTFDMKGGLVQAFVGLSELASLGGLEVLVTSDEEIGSPTSRQLVEETAGRVTAVLVPEPSGPGGAVKVARKGVAAYRVRLHGRASHAGLEPEAGVNALEELAAVVPRLVALGDSERGTTVTPTVASAGSAVNVVPADAWVKVDIRARSSEELRRVDRQVRALTTEREGSRLEVSGGENRPPLPRSASKPLADRLSRVADRLGLAVPGGVEVGGGSDGNFAAAVGTPTLDGLGAVGGGAHAEGEWIDTAAMTDRAALLAGLVGELLERPLGT